MVVIVHALPDYYYERLLNLTDEYSPLKRVALHVAHKQLDRATAVATSKLAPGISYAADRDVILEAEKELCRLFVTEEFCGLCGRYTDHRGEH